MATTYVTTSSTNTRTSPYVTRPLFRVTQLVWYMVGILEALLAFRFVLKLLAANPQAGFTNFIYSISQPFVAPFLNVFRIPTAPAYTTVGSTLEWTTLLAMLVYFLIALAIVKLVAMSRPVSQTEAEARLRQQD